MESEDEYVRNALLKVAKANGFYDIVFSVATQLYSGPNGQTELWNMFFIKNDPTLCPKDVINYFYVVAYDASLGTQHFFSNEIGNENYYGSVFNGNVVFDNNSWASAKASFEDFAKTGFIITVNAGSAMEPLIMPNETFEQALIRLDLTTI